MCRDRIAPDSGQTWEDTDFSLRMLAAQCEQWLFNGEANDRNTRLRIGQNEFAYELCIEVESRPVLGFDLAFNDLVNE